MKNLIYFLLFSIVGFSQNYQYSLEEGKIPPPVVLPTGVNNQKEEIEYFKAYLLPVSQKANLQKALDTYGAVRLEKGDYSGVNIVMKSNQKLYGHPSLSRVSNIIIAAGSTNVHLESLYPQGDKYITFQEGGVISNCTIKTIKWSKIIGTNVMLENNLFLDLNCNINFDCSASGYFRNNKVIRQTVHGGSDMIVMKGNTATPSYGNVHIATNLLGASGDATDIDGLASATFVGIDGEAWNNQGLGTRSLLNMQNMGNVKISELGGGSGGYPIGAPVYNIDAANLTFFHKDILPSEYVTKPSVLSSRTNLFYIKGRNDDYVRDYNTYTGLEFKGHVNNSDNYLNGVLQSIEITNHTALTNTILGTQYAPWDRPTWEILPDPLGANWKTERVGKPDNTAYIQNLINTVGIAELPEGVFYISSTLNLIVDGSRGIFGKGTGKTAIVGLTDDFPLITLLDSPTGDNNFVLSNLTLQGGSVGLYAPDEIDQMSMIRVKYLVFRNQNYGIHLHWIFGLDNCFFDNVSFIDCNIGLFQDPNYIGNNISDSGYIDKTLFYNGQYLNCGVAFKMNARRANNLNSWVNCKFDNNNKSLALSGNNFPIIANCDFTNHRSTPATGHFSTQNYEEDCIIENAGSLYSCNFYNNHNQFIINASQIYMEGCNLLDDITVFSNRLHHYEEHYIVNSTITGEYGGGWGNNSGLFVNSKFLSNSTFSKTLVNLKDNATTVLINTAPNPYPQFLVTQ